MKLGKLRGPFEPIARGESYVEAGKKPEVIFRSYRELVKPADAVKWFAIARETPANVIAAPMAAVAP